jgi:putative two-component system response regulator
MRQTQKPPSIRVCLPNLPTELDLLVQRMMAARPDDRFATPQALTRALAPFCRTTVMDLLLPSVMASRPNNETRESLQATPAPSPHTPPQPVSPARILVVDDEASIRKLCLHILQREGHVCDEASGGDEALAALAAKHYELVLLDCMMPRMSGPDVCRRIRETATAFQPRIIMLSGHISPDELAQMMLNGADDYLTKPFTSVQLSARVKATLRQKASQDRMHLLYQQLLTINRELEQNLTRRDQDMTAIRNALVQGLAKTVIDRGAETDSHLERMRRYVQRLAEEAATLSSLSKVIDPSLVERLVECAPLHDLGKVSLPDHILLKPGKLTEEERLLMQSHTILGAETLQGMAEKHAPLESFLRLAADMTRHHHEHYDGTGYPDGLSGDKIPLAARILAFADVYDALRSRRAYKPALSHNSALQVILAGSPGHFDPILTHAFQRCAGDFDRIFQEVRD